MDITAFFWYTFALLLIGSGSFIALKGGKSKEAIMSPNDSMSLPSNTNTPLSLLELILYSILLFWVVFATFFTLAAIIFDRHIPVDTILICLGGLFSLYAIYFTKSPNSYDQYIIYALVTYGTGFFTALPFIITKEVPLFFVAANNREKLIILASVYFILFFATLIISKIRKNHKEWLIDHNIMNLGIKINILGKLNNYYKLYQNKALSKKEYEDIKNKLLSSENDSSTGTMIREIEKINISENISKYYKLYQDGALSEKEYENIKNKLLSSENDSIIGAMFKKAGNYNIAKNISKYYKLYQDDALSEKEYEDIKNKLLSSEVGKNNISENISKYYKLYEDGALSEKEYIDIKNRLL